MFAFSIRKTSYEVRSKATDLFLEQPNRVTKLARESKRETSPCHGCAPINELINPLYPSKISLLPGKMKLQFHHQNVRLAFMQLACFNRFGAIDVATSEKFYFSVFLDASAVIESCIARPAAKSLSYAVLGLDYISYLCSL